MTKKRILIISPEVVFPADTGGKIRTATLARQLSRFSKVTILYMANGDINSFEANVEQERVSLGKYFNLWSLVSLWNPLTPKLPKNVLSNISKIRGRINPV